LIEFSEPIQRIFAGRRCCLALAESGGLFIVDVDFTSSPQVNFTIDSVQAELPSKRYSVQHMAVGWHFAAAVIKDIGLVVWKTDVPEHEPYPPTLKQRNLKARLIERPEETDENRAETEIIGLMVGDGYLVYLTKAGTVHRANVNDDTFSTTIPLSSFLLEQFKTTPQLSYLSGSFYHFGLFNTAGQVLIGNVSTQQTTSPLIPPGLQNRGIIGLSWGDWHALALCEDGSMLSWGKELRANGCLGMGYSDVEEARRMGLTVERMDVGSVEPRRIKGFGGMEDKFVFCVAAAGWHSAALVADFKVVEPRRREW
jgi:SCF-associated factor 1